MLCSRLVNEHHTAFLMYDAGQTGSLASAEAIRRPFVLIERTEPIN